MGFRQFIALILSVINALFISTGVKKVNVVEKRPETVTAEVSDILESPMLLSAQYAKNISNAVQATYTTTKRKAYRMSNENMILTHKLTGAVKTASLTDRDGNTYFNDGFRTFYTDKAGVEHGFENSTEKGRVNTIRLGEYYYECHVRDLADAKFKVDKTFHVYGDRLYVQYSLLSEKPVEKLYDFGSEFTVPYSSVDSLIIKDKNGIHEKIDGVDYDSVEYVAFDTKDAGVLGFIVPSDSSAKRLVVTYGVTGYSVKQYAAFDASAGLNDYNENGGYGLNAVTFGCRVYTDGTHSFDGIQKAAHEEREPLENIVVEKGTANSVYLGYDALRGAYTLQMDGVDFQTAYDNPQLQYTAPISIKSDEDRTVYFRSYGLCGCLEAAAIIDEQDRLVPMEVQVCKNFCGDGGESFYGAKDYQYGDAFFPVRVKGGEPVKFTLIDLYQNWGTFPIKQLSSIEFHTSYYHISTGTTESNCIAPYFVGNKDGWTLPDFRNRSGNIWSGQPQFNSVGILKFMSHTNKGLNTTFYNELAGTEIASTGLAYCDIRNTYVDDCGDFTFTLRHAEMPQTDENRTYYTVKLEFDKDVTYRDFRNEFDMFYFDGRFVRFDKACYLNENNEAVSVDAGTDGKVNFYTLGNEAPFYGFYKVTADTDYQIDNCFGCNFALIIRDSKIIINGEQSDIPFAFREKSDGNATCGVLTLDADTLSFKKGDTIELNMVLLPWGTGRENTYDTVMRVREDSALKPITVTAKKGTVIEDDILPVVKAEENEAIFTVKGGRNNNAVTVTGFPSVRAPRIQIMKDGEWTEYVTSSAEHGFDGYTVKIADDGTYSYSFVYEAADPDTEYTFRVVAVR